MRLRSASVVAAIVLALLTPGSAGAVATFPAWHDLTGDVGTGGVVVDTAGAGPGTPLHVVWSASGSLFERDIAVDGSLGETSTLLAGQTGLTNPSIARNPVDGSSWVFGASTSLFGGQLFGIHDAAPPVAISTSVGAAAADSSTSVFTRTGTAYQAFGTTVHRGLGVDPTEHDLFHDGRCCRSWSQLALDSRGGAPLLAYSSSVPNRQGLEVANVATGLVRYVPRSATADRRFSVNGGLPTSISGRIGGPGVYVAFCEGYPRCARGDLWRYGAREPFVVITGKGLRYLRVVPAPRGRLWVMWYHGGLVWARRSNPSVTQFGGIVGAAVPGNIRSTVRRIAGDASRGPLLDAFTTQRGTDGVEATWTTQLLPGLSITTRGAPRVGSTIRVRVEDAGTPLHGASVSLRGVTSHTDRHGYASVRLTRAGTAFIRVTMTGYTGDTVKLPVRG